MSRLRDYVRLREFIEREELYALKINLCVEKYVINRMATLSISLRTDDLYFDG